MTDEKIAEPTEIMACMPQHENDSFYCLQCFKPMESFVPEICCDGEDCFCSGLPQAPCFCSEDCKQGYWNSSGIAGLN